MVYTIYYILYTIYNILYTIYGILHTIYHIPYTIYYILYTIYYILYTIYYILYKQQQKLSESFPGKYFSPCLRPSNEHAENLLPEVTFDHFWASHRKCLKIDFRRVLLTISGAKQRKCSKSIAGGHF